MRGNTRVSFALSLSQQAKRIPKRTFFLWKGRAFSYADANRRIDAVVRGLISCGVQREMRVGILMRPRPSFLTMVTAINRIGAVAVLLNAQAEDMSLARAYEIGEVEVLVTDPDNAERARSTFGGQVFVLGAAHEKRSLPADVVDMETIDPDLVQLPGWYRPNPGRARDLSMIILTAGRTGEPRASQITNRRWAVAALGAAAACTLTTKDTVYSCLPLHHAAGALVAAGSALVGGARLALGTQFTPDTFWTEVRRYGATVVFYAGEMCRDLVDAPHVAAETNHPIRLFAGSGMRRDVWGQLTDRFGNVGVLEFYATTEGNAVLANASGEKVGSLGRPMPGSAEMALVAYDFESGDFSRDDSNHYVRSDRGDVGMLIARADDTHPGTDGPSGRIRHNVFADGDRWFFTGDLMRRDADGDYWFVDRLSDMIMTEAGPVASLEIEDALYSHPDVHLATAYAVGGTTVATIVVDGGRTIDGASLYAAIETTLDAHARPDYIRCVAEIAMTDGRRPIKRPLREAGIAPRPGVDVLRRDDSAQSYRAEVLGESREVTL
jgi:putative long chain acyl-CoA synthase